MPLAPVSAVKWLAPRAMFITALATVVWHGTIAFAQQPGPATSAEVATLAKLLDDAWQRRLDDEPQFASRLGDPRGDGVFIRTRTGLA